MPRRVSTYRISTAGKQRWRVADQVRPVDADWSDLVQADVEDFLGDTSLAHATIVPCSASTGVGLEPLQTVLQEALGRERGRRHTGRPRLPSTASHSGRLAPRHRHR